MSDTPWTDNHERVGKIRSSGAVMGVVPSVYVRELETELAEALAEIERKDKLIEQMRELLQLKNAILGHCRFVTYPPKKIIEKLEKIEAALLAAERGE